VLAQASSPRFSDTVASAGLHSVDYNKRHINLRKIRNPEASFEGSDPNIFLVTVFFTRRLSIDELMIDVTCNFQKEKAEAAADWSEH